ncbi:MAG: hypothetical protein KDA76_12265 [Planctomycetaceae bacterium]|nr:hypothetical protein [Planctomycetaceae bacterium]
MIEHRSHPLRHLRPTSSMYVLRDDRPAADALRAIVRHILPRDPDHARAKLRELTARYPGTPSARRAAELLQALLIEQSEKYCEIAARRLSGS